MKIKQVTWFDEHWYKIEEDKKPAVYYPSTTTKLQAIAKPGLIRWYGDIGTREAKKRTRDAGDRGSRIHYALQVMAMGGAIIYDPPKLKGVPKEEKYTPEEMQKIREEYKNVFTLENQDEMLDVYKVKQLFKILKPEILGIEQVVYSVKNKEAGTVDIVIGISGGKYEGIMSKPITLPEGILVLDYKSGSLYDEASMQLASYTAMYKELNPESNLVGSMIVHTGSSTKTGIAGLSLVYKTMEELREDYKDFRAVAQMWKRQNKNAMPKLLEFPALISL